VNKRKIQSNQIGNEIPVVVYVPLLGRTQERAATAEARLREVDQIIYDAAALAAEAAAAVITGDLRQGDNGRWTTGKGAPSVERLKPLWTHLRPALERVARWWDGVRGRVEALPDPEQQAFFDEVPPEGSEEGPGV